MRRPRRWRTAVRGLPVLGALVAALCGCTGVADRSGDADAVTVAMRGMDGVESATYEYANGITTGQSFNLSVALDDGASAAEVAQIAAAYDSRIADLGFTDHTLRLTVRYEKDMLIVFSDRARRDPVAAVVGRWFALGAKLDEPVLWRTGGGTADLIEVTTSHVQDLVERLRADAADLESAHWLVHTTRSRLDLVGKYPDPAVSNLMSDLVAQDLQWNVTLDPSATPALAFAVWHASDSDVEVVARADLRRIAALGTPATYTVKLPGETPTVVQVRGCLTTGTPLQQSLNREFGSC